MLPTGIPEDFQFFSLFFVGQLPRNLIQIWWSVITDQKTRTHGGKRNILIFALHKLSDVTLALSNISPKSIFIYMIISLINISY